MVETCWEQKTNFMTTFLLTTEKKAFKNLFPSILLMVLLALLGSTAMIYFLTPKLEYTFYKLAPNETFIKTKKNDAQYKFIHRISRIPFSDKIHTIAYVYTDDKQYGNKGAILCEGKSMIDENNFINHGIWNFYNPFKDEDGYGKIQRRASFWNGLYHGPDTLFNSANGAITMTGTHTYDLMDGVFAFYDEKGEILYEEIYRTGKKLTKGYNLALLQKKYNDSELFVSNMLMEKAESNPDSSEYYYTLASKVCNENTIILEKLGMLYLKQSNIVSIQKARDNFEQAIVLNHPRPYALQYLIAQSYFMEYTLGNCLIAQVIKEYEETAQFCEQFNYANSLQADLRFNIAEISWSIVNTANQTPPINKGELFIDGVMLGFTIFSLPSDIVITAGKKIARNKGLLPDAILDSEWTETGIEYFADRLSDNAPDCNNIEMDYGAIIVKNYQLAAALVPENQLYLKKCEAAKKRFGK